MNIWIEPDWPAPKRVRAISTTRQGGVSRPPFEVFNLAEHVGDEALQVAANRACLVAALQLPAEPVWLNQVHGNHAADAATARTNCEADAAYSDQPGNVCAVLTADCLPVLFCDRLGREVAAAHAGWRGLAGGILEATLQGLKAAPGDILVWLGPAIGPQAFEVGDEVRQAFISQACHQTGSDETFRPSANGRWLADLYRLARQRLVAQGVTDIYGGDRCTFSESEYFYSHRRDGLTGRMASLIWLVG